MSMAMAVEYTAEWFRSKYHWTYMQCGVQFEALPPLENTGYFYIAVDDYGVESGPDETDSLKEICTIQIGVWIRPEHYNKDRIGELKLPNDLYLANTLTLDDLERKVIVHQSNASNTTLNSRDGLHNNWTFVNGLNTRYSLPSSTLGAAFMQPFRYKGRGKMEAIGLSDDMNGRPAWYGYRLRMRGLVREQKLRSSTDAIG